MPGVSFQSRAIGVGSHQPESFPAMSRTKRGSRYNTPLHIIPEGVKASEDSPEGLSVFEGEQGPGVFANDVLGLQFPHDP